MTIFGREKLRETITQERLKEVLYYNPQTGSFKWAKTRRGVRVGQDAGRISRLGYHQISIDRRSYLAHRLAWLYMEGFFPTNIEIDHIDQNPSNNKWNNLRLVSRSCNARNCGNGKRNKSGVKGVVWDKSRQKWEAKIGANGRSNGLGRYTSFDNAVCARLAAEQCLGWHGCNSNSPAYKYVKNEIQAGAV
jgi:hypothetical protein